MSNIVTEQIAIRSSSTGQTSIKTVFQLTSDRWSHAWSIVNNGAEQSFLKSLEGTPDQAWPPSPPLQDISQHTLESGDAVLGVGMAGKSHWSASYSIEKSDRQDQTTLIQSDLACLQKEVSEAATIGSSYEVDSTCQVRSFAPHRIEILSGDQLVIVIDAMAGDGFETVFDLEDRVLHIKPRLISNSPVVATRWGYRVQLTP